MARSQKYIRCNESARRRSPALLLGALTAALVVACVACRAGAFPTVSELPTEPRRPDGVVLEPPVTLPESVERSGTEAPLVALREQLDERSVVALVRSYFTAWEREDLDALGRLLSADATLLGNSGGRPLDAFRVRVRRYEYQRIAGMEPALFDRLERTRYGDLEPRQRPQEMREGDLLVRVPVLVAHVGGEPLFGDVLVLLVRREAEGLRVVGIGEESGDP